LIPHDGSERYSESDEPAWARSWATRTPGSAVSIRSATEGWIFDMPPGLTDGSPSGIQLQGADGSRTKAPTRRGRALPCSEKFGLFQGKRTMRMQRNRTAPTPSMLPRPVISIAAVEHDGFGDSTVRRSKRSGRRTATNTIAGYAVSPLRSATARAEPARCSRLQRMAWQPDDLADYINDFFEPIAVRRISPPVARPARR